MEVKTKRGHYPGTSNRIPCHISLPQGTALYVLLLWRCCCFTRRRKRAKECLCFRCFSIQRPFVGSSGSLLFRKYTGESKFHVWKKKERDIKKKSKFYLTNCRSAGIYRVHHMATRLGGWCWIPAIDTRCLMDKQSWKKAPEGRGVVWNGEAS